MDRVPPRPPSQITSKPVLPKPAGDKERPKTSQSQTRIEMTCPTCGTAGTIKVVSLGQQIACKKCSARFRITHTGKIVPASESQILKRPAFDEGLQPPPRLVRAWTRLPIAGKASIVAGGVLASVLLVYLTMVMSRTRLPDGLEERARMAGEAVARNYPAHVRALAFSGTQGQAEEWLGRVRPAGWAQAITRDTPVRIEVKVVFQDAARAGTLLPLQPGVDDDALKDVQLLQRGDAARAAEQGTAKVAGAVQLGQVQLLLYWSLADNDWLLDGKQTLQNMARTPGVN